MRSQSGFAKANLLNMHTKALIRPFDKGAPANASFWNEKGALHAAAVRFITGLSQRQAGPDPGAKMFPK
jgi:hypothetical protein